MNHEQIEALAAVLKDVPSLTEVEVRHGGTVLRLRRGGIPAAIDPLPVSPRSGRRTVGGSQVRAFR